MQWFSFQGNGASRFVYWLFFILMYDCWIINMVRHGFQAPWLSWIMSHQSNFRLWMTVFKGHGPNFIAAWNLGQQEERLWPNPYAMQVLSWNKVNKLYTQINTRQMGFIIGFVSRLRPIQTNLWVSSDYLPNRLDINRIHPSSYPLAIKRFQTTCPTQSILHYTTTPCKKPNSKAK